MKKILLSLLVTIAGFYCYADTVSAQTINSILKKLQTVELRLNELDIAPQDDLYNKIENVEVSLATFETVHKHELAIVQTKLNELDILRAETVSETYIESLQAQIDHLYNEMKDISLAVNSGHVSTASLNEQAPNVQLASVQPAGTLMNQPATAEIQNIGSQLPLEIENVYTGEYFSKVKGGLNKKNGGSFRGNYDLTITASSENLGLWKGTTFFVYMENGNGKGITESYVGDMQVLSNIDERNFTQVSMFVISHSFADDRLSIKLGKLDGNEDFNAVDNAGDFINSSFGIMPNVELPIFPHFSLGIASLVSLSDNVTLGAGLYDGRGWGGSWGFDTAFGAGALSASVVELTYGAGLLPWGSKRGALKLGAWRHGGEYEPIAKADAKSYNSGGYLILEQGLFGDSDEGGPSLDMFFQYGYADKDISEIPNYLGLGFRTAGMLRSRPDDSMGIGIANAMMNSNLVEMKDETVLEFYYQTNFLNVLTLQPDVQYIINTGGEYDNALVVGLRTYFEF